MDVQVPAVRSDEALEGGPIAQSGRSDERMFTSVNVQDPMSLKGRGDGTSLRFTLERSQRC